jgi:hypothetical protein
MKKQERTAEAIIRESEAAIRFGVDIARAESLRESEEMFLGVMPHIHDAFYDYIETGYFTLSRFTVKNEDMKRADNPLIPVDLSFMYNMIEHLFAYNCVHDTEIQGRLYKIFQFVKGFEEVGFGVYVKVQDDYVFMVNTNKGKTYKTKVEGLKYIDINREYYYITGVKEDGKVVVLTDAYMDITKKKGWKKTGTPRKDDGYIQIEHTDKKTKKKLSFREHTVMVALVYGIEVAKHTIGHNCFITIDHINGVKDDNRIENLRLVTRQTNSRLEKNINYDAYDFLDIYKKMKDTYKDYKLL